jgi:probable F420-dependent oxidoreductase
MKFGYLTMGFDLQYQAACAIHAEKRGFESAWLPDHLAMPAEIPRSYPYLFDEEGNPRLDPRSPIFDPWVLISHLATATRTLRFGTAVYLLPLRDPVAVARSLVTLDHLSHGRVTLGVGVGWFKEEFEALGVPFHRRGALADESIQLLRQLWHEDVVTHEGAFYTIRDLSFYPKPVQQPAIPVHIGGASPAALRRAGTLGDGWLDAGSTDLDEIARQIKTIDQHRHEAGRSDMPFEITLVNNNIFNSPDAVRRARDLGVTRIVVSPLQGPFSPGRLSCESDYLRFIDAYADAVIDKV